LRLLEFTYSEKLESIKIPKQEVVAE